MRRALHEPRIGHTGTLDPAATGVLLLVLGRATRLARFLSASDKSYEAVVRLGFATDTLDARGRTIGPVSQASLPSREAIDAALDAFRGTFLQQPPAFSAKKIDGTRSHKLARAHARAAALPALAVIPALASVTTHRLEIVSVEADTVTQRGLFRRFLRARSRTISASGRRGGHPATLRRVRTAFSMRAIGSMRRARPQRAAAAVIPLADMLPTWRRVDVQASGAPDTDASSGLRTLRPIRHAASD
jgi:tRNA pseudouridine55 synthase